MSAVSRWLTWQPGQKYSDSPQGGTDKTDKTPPAEGFVNFVSSPPGVSQIFRPANRPVSRRPVALEPDARGWREGTVCPGCLALRWLDRRGRHRCDCEGRPATVPGGAGPAPTDHPAGCVCGWCWAWRNRQPFHALIKRAEPHQKLEPARFPRDWIPCACGGDHRPCGVTGECGLRCRCGLCARWRRVMGYGDGGGVQ
jgi:hypothetical protein